MVLPAPSESVEHFPELLEGHTPACQKKSLLDFLDKLKQLEESLSRLLPVQNNWAQKTGGF